MAQNSRFLRSAGYGLALSIFVFSVSSCIDELYDLNKGISMDMELGGDSLAIPIGTTDTIKLGDYLDSDVLSMLKTMENGGYGITISDTITPEIPDIDESKLKMEDQIKTVSKPVDFGDIDLENFTIPGFSKESNVNLGLSTYSLSNFEIPPINTSTTTDVGMTGYALTSPKVNDINANASQDNLLATVITPPNPGGHIGVPLPDLAAATINTSSTMETNVHAPNGVSDIGNVLLKDGAVFEVTIELVGASSIFKTGELIPSFTIDPDGLFEFTNQPSNGVISFTNADSLTVANQFKKVKSYPISKLNISGSPVAGIINISKNIAIIGSMAMKNAIVWSDQLVNVQGLDLKVSVAVKNMEISSMEFNIPTLNADIPSNSANMKINNSIPEQIEKINKVLFYNPATITIDLTTLNMPVMKSSTINIDNLTISFPEQFVFEPMPGLTNNVYRVTNEALKPAGNKIQLVLKELDMSKIPVVNGMLTWNGKIDYSGTVSFGGRINSNEIPSVGSDAQVKVQFGSSTSFKSAEVTTNKISVDMPAVQMPISFPIKIADQVKRLDVVKMKPGTKIRIDLSKPSLPLTFSANNMQVNFPDMFIFNPPLIANTLVMNGALEDSVILYLDSLKINKELTNGELTIDDNIKISGGVDLLPGVANSTEIESLSSKSMTVTASTSTLGITSTSIKLKDLDFPTSDSIPLNFPNSDIPSLLVSLDSVLLKDNAKIQLAVGISNMPNFGSDVNVNLVVNFPGMFIFSPGMVNNKNQLIIKEPLVNGKLNKILTIRGMKFDGSNLNGQLNINEWLKYTAGVSILSPKVNSDELAGNNITITVEAKISNIAFKSVFGKLDPGIKPQDQNISLDEVYKQLNDNNVDVVLDVTKPIISIKTECNLGIPIDANVKLTPKIGNTPTINNPIDITLKIPKSSAPKDTLKRTYWISPDSVGMPTGSEFIGARVQDLFRKVPENVQMLATITTDKTQQHMFDITADYKFKLAYEVTIPFAFGKDFSVKVQKDIEVSDPNIGEMASSVGGIALLGSIQNSIPLELNLAIVALNSDMHPIAGLDTVTQVISAGAHDGSAVASPITLKISDSTGKLKDLRGFRLLFSAASNETVAATPIKPENFIKADLKVRVDGGINLKKFTDN